jgi:hypothetical protein
MNWEGEKTQLVDIDSTTSTSDTSGLRFGERSNMAVEGLDNDSDSRGSARHCK